MTPNEFKALYLGLQGKMDVQQTLMNTVRDNFDDLDTQQSELSTQHLDDLTDLKSGQAIELAGKDDDGIYSWALPASPLVVVEVLQADVFTDEDSRLPDGGPTDIYITALVSAVPGEADTIALDPQPGAQWRYPEAATCVTTGKPKEAA